ncbi:MAG: hypothetical protein WCS89_03095 [Candidatus Paceibacterota bacterium]|jgi:arginyl-tRNA--protein-N-Asp/Glu arginylyltransferase
MKYLSWNETVVTDFSPEKISEMYEKGYVFTRIEKGAMQQTRSVRIDLSKFELSSENRRILKKVPDLKIESIDLPLADYDYSIGKMAKYFYEIKFGPKIMSAQKVKMMLSDKERSNFNKLLKFTASPDVTPGSPELTKAKVTGPETGYTITFAGPRFLHYSYPFYDLKNSPKDMGLAMMTKTIQYAKEIGLKYVYLGSLQRPTDVYKLQFSGLEWFDGQTWSDDIEKVKNILGTF